MKINRRIIRAVLVYAVYILGLGLLQTILSDRVAILNAKPDLTLVLAVLAGYLFGQRDGIAIGLLAGFMRDALAGRGLGLGMLLLMYAGLTAAVAFRGFFRRNISLGLILVILETVIYHLMITFLTFAVPVLPGVAYTLPGLYQHMLQILPGALITNTLAGIPLILLLYFAGPYRRGGRPEEDDEERDVGDSLWQMK